MKINIKCPNCNKIIRVDIKKADTRHRCPHCYLLFKIPTKEELAKAISIIKNSDCSGVYVDEEGNTYA